MRKITVGFSKNADNKVFSRGLQDYMDRDYSHCFVKYFTKRHLGDDAIYHSSLSAGVGYMSQTIFEENNTIVLMYEIEVSDEMYTSIREGLFKVCGRKYGMMQNIGILLVDALRKLGIKAKNPFVKGENCSEMVYRHILSVLYPEYDYDPDTISPKDVEDILNKKAKRIL
jgi:hypothetical protein